MFRILKKASLVVAALAITVIGSATVFAAVEGGIEPGDIYFAKNVTKGTGFVKSTSADKDETVQYRVRVHNPGPGIVNGVTVKATIPNGVSNNANSTVTLNAINNSQGPVTDSVAVSLAGSYNVNYIPGSTELLDGNAAKISTLPDTILSSGVNIGDVGVSLAEKRFVQFSVKITAPEVPVCPPGTTGTPPNCVKPPVTPPTSTTKTTPPAAPVTPSVIPSTGPEAAFAGILGSGALGYGIRQWFNSRRSLRDLLK